MDKSKKGIMMAIYLPLITAFICGVAISLYIVQDKALESNLVSPKTILNISDQKQIFEIWENKTLYGVAEESNPKQAFCQAFAEVNKSILNLFGDGDAAAICNNLYDFSPSVDKLTVVRKETTKTGMLRVEESSKNNFPVKFEFKFSKTYIISKP
jgi:hypothetical protein